jgi:hypothetical protein
MEDRAREAKLKEEEILRILVLYSIKCYFF